MVSVLDSRLEDLGSNPCRVIVLCSWARHFTLTVPLSTQVYKWVPANCQGKLTKFWGVTCDGLAKHPIQEGVAILLVASCYKNWDKLRLYGKMIWAFNFFSLDNLSNCRFIMVIELSGVQFDLKSYA